MKNVSCKQGSLLDMPTPAKKTPPLPDMKKRMSKLERLIEELCPNGVPFERLENHITLKDSERRPVTKKDRTAGCYPYYGANGIQDYVGDFIFDGTFLLVGEDGSVITESGTPILNWAVGKIWVNNHAHILIEKKGTLLRYIYYALQYINISTLVRGTPPKLNQQNLNNIKIPVPPLPVQEEIVRILDTFSELTSELISELTAELNKRKQRYQYYKEYIIKKQKTYRIVKIKNIAKTVTVGIANSTTHAYSDTGIVMFRNLNIKENYLDDKNIIYISPDFEKKYKNKRLQENDILITRTGYPGQACVVPSKYAGCQTFTTLILRLKDNNITNPFYICHYINSNAGKKYVRQTQLGAAQQNFNANSLANMPIILPPLEEQERIVSILDRFDSLCNDLTSNLSAEIEARKKQYEYYRDKLLTFKEAK